MPSTCLTDVHNIKLPTDRAKCVRQTHRVEEYGRTPHCQVMEMVPKPPNSDSFKFLFQSRKALACILLVRGVCSNAVPLENPLPGQVERHAHAAPKIESRGIPGSNLQY